MENSIFVNSEVSRLEKLIIHSPDSGLGKVVPSKAQDWLFEDIIHLDTMRRKEYDLYVKLLLYFVDPDAIKYYDESGDKNRDFFKPNTKNYFKSDKVVDLERLLFEVLKDEKVKIPLIAAIAAVEECSYNVMKELLAYPEHELSKILITGTNDTDKMYFPPLPNLIFTRDLGVVINDHILLTKPLKSARTRESLIAKYIFFNHSFFSDFKNNIIEIEEDENHFLLPEENSRRLDTLEGGDVMMVAPNHVLIGISERTSLSAAKQAVKKLFDKNVVEKVSIVKIPSKRDFMHIDTVFTQIKRNVWVILPSMIQKTHNIPDRKAWDDLSVIAEKDKVVVKQFINNNGKVTTKDFNDLGELLTSVSIDDLHSKEPVEFVYSGNNIFPFGEREQWTDSCNLLVLNEGVAIAYDRNDKTDEAFVNIGFSIIEAEDLLRKLSANEVKTEDLKDTIILLPSAELSRARGGSHCMSLPLKRANIMKKFI